MQGTILILDAVATNRIMLKVQLCAAYYRVVQGDRLDGALAIARRVQPDLILTAMTLPDGDACALIRALRADDTLARVPVIAVTPQTDRSTRLRALAAGVDDVLAQPLDDLMLRARIRSLIRARNSDDELRPKEDAGAGSGLAEDAALFLPAAQVPLLASDTATATRWQRQLEPVLPYRLHAHPVSDMSALLRRASAPDAFVLALSDQREGPGLGLLSDLRARSGTRHAAILAVPDPKNAGLAAEALDLGADDVMPDGFCPEELALRLSSQLRRKARADRWRDGVRQGLRAALRDPMTGLYNRRHALPHLARTARRAANTGQSFAVMLADLDHFKKINDTLGHAVGDAVIVETARRLRQELGLKDMLARVGGEEFMIVLENVGPDQATGLAEALRHRINAAPFSVEGSDSPIQVTISIGLAVIQGPSDRSCTLAARGLMDQADRALYVAKGAGRNQVSLIEGAA